MDNDTKDLLKKVRKIIYEHEDCDADEYCSVVEDLQEALREDNE